MVRFKAALVLGLVTHVCVGVLSLGFGQRGVAVGAVVFTEVVGGLRVGGDQQLLDVSLWRKRTNRTLNWWIVFTGLREKIRGAEGKVRI